MAQEKRIEITQEYCKYVFTENEIKNIANEMARRISEIEDKEAEKKAITSQLKSDLDALYARLRSLAVKHKDGYEMRDMDCYIEKDYTNREVRVIRVDTEEIVKIIKMKSDDFQKDLPLDVETEESSGEDVAA